MDVVDWYGFTKNDIIGDLTFGESFNCIGSEYVHPENKEFHESLRPLSWFASFQVFNFLATERSLLLVLNRSVTVSIYTQFDLTRETIYERLETRAEVRRSP